jgi:hypothetical protein
MRKFDELVEKVMAVNEVSVWKPFLDNLETNDPDDKKKAIDYFHSKSKKDQKVMLHMLDQEFKDAFAKKIKKELGV